MAKRKDIVPASVAASTTGESDAAKSTPAVEASATEPKFDPAGETPADEAPVTASVAIEAPKTEPANAEVLKIEPSKIDDSKPENVTRPLSGTVIPAAFATSNAHRTPHGFRFAMLAASVVLAAALGAIGGGLATANLTQPTAPAPVPPTTAAAQETAALGKTLAQMRTDVAALRTSVEQQTRAANGQFGKIADRIERVERAQAEPSAKLAKVAEGIDRLARRETAPADPATTGSIPAATPAAAAATPAQPPILQGWVLRGVYRGAALVQGGGLGTIEVEAGDILPGVGRVESIKRQKGRWVVVTSKGLIASMR
jgi:hypothetical protein